MIVATVVSEARERGRMRLLVRNAALSGVVSQLVVAEMRLYMPYAGAWTLVLVVFAEGNTRAASYRIVPRCRVFLRTVENSVTRTISSAFAFAFVFFRIVFVIL